MSPNKHSNWGGGNRQACTNWCQRRVAESLGTPGMNGTANAQTVSYGRACNRHHAMTVDPCACAHADNKVCNLRETEQATPPKNGVTCSKAPEGTHRHAHIHRQCCITGDRRLTFMPTLATIARNRKRLHAEPRCGYIYRDWPGVLLEAGRTSTQSRHGAVDFD